MSAKNVASFTWWAVKVNSNLNPLPLIFAKHSTFLSHEEKKNIEMYPASIDENNIHRGMSRGSIIHSIEWKWMILFRFQWSANSLFSPIRISESQHRLIYYYYFWVQIFSAVQNKFTLFLIHFEWSSSAGHNFGCINKRL